MPEHWLTFACEGESLAGILHEPETSGRDVGILVVVGGPQYRVGSHRQFVLMARSFAAEGYPVLRFDCRGMGDSTGEPRTFEAVEADIRAAVDAFLAKCPAIRGVVIFGLCDAASAALMYCTADARIQGLILANPWVRTEAGEARARVRHYYWNRIFQHEFWKKTLTGQLHPSTALGGFLASWRRARGTGTRKQDGDTRSFLQCMKNGIGRFHGPILLLMSERDLTAREFDDLCRTDLEWARCLSKASVYRSELAGADHTFSSAIALHAASQEVLGWLGGTGFAGGPTE